MPKGLSVGIIMDGNRRYAAQNGEEGVWGHQKGVEATKQLIRELKSTPITELTLYAFSTENWNRSKSEVQGLMKLFESGLAEIGDEVHTHKIALRFIGQQDRFPRSLQNLMARLQKETKKYKTYTLNICVSYGGRAEMVDAVNALLKKGAKRVNETTLRARMWTREMRDPEIIIRTGGEKRLSNFLLWQSAYSELFFTDTLWPAFTMSELKKILAEFEKRHRRMGK